MLAFIIKSTICLTVLYGFYHLVLRNGKTFDFNRFYLVFSLLFSLIIPLITITVDLPFNHAIQELPSVKGDYVLVGNATYEPVHNFPIRDVALLIYFIVSFALLLRFALNIHKIIRLINTNSKMPYYGSQIVLIENKTLPYSFFRYVFVNRSDYENGIIGKELLIHEQTHCAQYHSVDILIIELVKIILWFNPLLWFFRKAIQLNHEYLADNKVLSNHDLNDYQNTLINLVFRNNSTYLASNFNYSLTKKRLIMMMKNDSSKKAILKKIVAIPLFLILAVTSCFSQEFKPKENLQSAENAKSYENEWWYPILKKNNIELGSFNNLGKVFETGTKNTINNRVVTLENAVFIINEKNDNYGIFKSPLAHHDLDKDSIWAKEVTLSSFNLKSGTSKSFGTVKNFRFVMRKDGTMIMGSSKRPRKAIKENK